MTSLTQATLLARAHALSGYSIGEVARAVRRPLPENGHKGYVGTLVERALGIVPSSRAGPDAPAIGVEIKTLPLDPRGIPRESTFVCMVPREGLERSWESSHPREKLACVLFVPVEATGPLATRRVGTAFYWSPSLEEEGVLAADWLELSGRLATHGETLVSARVGRALQVRPKGANAAARWLTHDGDGAPVLAPPRAFYLRRVFVATIVARAGLAPPSAPAYGAAR